jgi:molecular chaperone IbpA
MPPLDAGRRRTYLTGRRVPIDGLGLASAGPLGRPSCMLLQGGYVAMLTIDFTPLFRSSVGFDGLARLLETTLPHPESGEPGYEIARTGEDAYRVTLAVPGFAEQDLTVELTQNQLRVVGRRARRRPAGVLYRGLGPDEFERRFQLADHIRVVAARLADGLLEIELVREIPEAMKPRRIAIGGGEAGGRSRKLIEASAA